MLLSGAVLAFDPILDPPKDEPPRPAAANATPPAARLKSLLAKVDAEGEATFAAIGDDNPRCPSGATAPGCTVPRVRARAVLDRGLMDTPAPKLSVGSKNPAKVGAVLAAARHYWGERARVVGHDVPSGVRAQPLGHEETQGGAVNRARGAFTWARGALAAEPGALLGLGLEGGVVLLAGQPVMMGYVAITDGLREVVVPTVGTPLPAAWAEALALGAELRPFVQAAGYNYDYQQGVVGLLTNGALQRDDAFRAAVTTALAPWVNPALYAR